MSPIDSDIEALLRAHAERARESHSDVSARAVASLIVDRFKEMSNRVAQLEREVQSVRSRVSEHEETTGRYEIAKLTERAKQLEAERKSWVGFILKTIVSIIMLGLGVVAQKLFGNGKHP